MSASLQSKRLEIEKRYRMDIRATVGKLYRRHGNLAAVANDLGVSRQSLYVWLGRQEIAMLKAQAGMREGGEDQEIRFSVQN
jgi:transcriptional regulator with PAS, ATPase and Fis domain